MDEQIDHPTWLRIPNSISDLIPFRIAVGIKQTAVDQLHTGILYHYRKETYLLHLAWHNKLVHSLVASDAGYHWVIPSIEKSKTTMIAARLRQIAKQNVNGFPYAPGRPFAHCEEDGRIVLDERCKGLTCASFVALLFEKLGQKIINLDEWEPRASDQEWIDKIVDWMRKGDVSPDHIDIIKSMGLPIRIRPEEIAAGASFNPLPSGFEYAVNEGGRIVTYLKLKS